MCRQDKYWERVFRWDFIAVGSRRRRKSLFRGEKVCIGDILKAGLLWGGNGQWRAAEGSWGWSGFNHLMNCVEDFWGVEGWTPSIVYTAAILRANGRQNTRVWCNHLHKLHLRFNQNFSRASSTWKTKVYCKQKRTFKEQLKIFKLSQIHHWKIPASNRREELFAFFVKVIALRRETFLSCLTSFVRSFSPFLSTYPGHNETLILKLPPFGYQTIAHWNLCCS